MSYSGEYHKKLRRLIESTGQRVEGKQLFCGSNKRVIKNSFNDHRSFYFIINFSTSSDCSILLLTNFQNNTFIELKYHQFIIIDIHVL